MSDKTNIEWCDSTFNPWIGCAKVGPGCDHCYAEVSTPSRTLGVVWGPKAERRRTSPGNWALPMRWEREHDAFFAQHGRRRRVFCASLADVFDNQVPVQWRIELMKLILATPHLDWLLVTKRIGNAAEMLDVAFRAVHAQRETWANNVPPNVWLGITVVNQEEADRDISKLLAVQAGIRFLSIEPLLGPISFEGLWANQLDVRDHTNALEALDWVIVGGESGPNARPMHPDWARSLRDQCAAAGVPFLFKQWGEWAEFDADGLPGIRSAREGDPEFWSMANACDAFMSVTGEVRTTLDGAPDGVGYRGLVRTGKKAAGRLLDGVEHNGFPASVVA